MIFTRGTRHRVGRHQQHQRNGQQRHRGAKKCDGFRANRCSLHGNILAEHVEDRIELEGLDQNSRDLLERMMDYMERRCIGIPMKAAKDSIK